MLCEAGNALALAAVNDNSGHGGGQERIFGVVLKGTTVEGAAVNVRAGASPREQAHKQRLVAIHLALLLQQLNVPGCSSNGGGLPAGTAELNGAILAAIAIGEQLHQFFPGQGVHVGIPQLGVLILGGDCNAVDDGRLSVSLARQVSQANRGLCALGPAFGNFGNVPGLAFLVHVGVVDFLCVQHCSFPVSHDALLSGLCGGLLQAGGTGNHVVQQVVTDGGEVVLIHVLDFGTGHQVGLALDAAGNGEVLGEHNVVGVALHGQAVGAGFQLITGEAIVVGIIPVIGSHVLCSHFDGDHVAFAGLEELGLGVADQDSLCLFDAAVIIRSVGIQLHHILTGNAAGVGNLHGNGDNLIGSGDGGIRCASQLPVKGGVAQAVAEGIGNGFLIPALPVGIVVCLGFVVAVAVVDALAELGITEQRQGAVLILEPGIHPVAFFINVLAHVREVGEGGILGEIAGPDINGVAGGVDLAGQDIGSNQSALVADAADPQDCVNTILGIHRSVQLGNLHDVGGVNHDNDLFEVGLGQLNEFQFVVIQLQIVVIGVGVAFHAVGGQIHVLAAKAAEAHNGHIVIGCKGAGNGLAEIAHGRLQELAGVVGLMDTAQNLEQVLIHRDGLGVHMEAGLLESIIPAQLVVGAFGSAGAAAATVVVNGANTQEGDVALIGTQRQRAIFVLQQNLTLACHLQMQTVAGFQRFIETAVVGVETTACVQVAGHGAGEVNVLGVECLAHGNTGNHGCNHGASQCKREHTLNKLVHFLSSFFILTTEFRSPF